MTDDNMPAEIWAMPDVDDPSELYALPYEPIGPRFRRYIRQPHVRTVGEDGMPGTTEFVLLDRGNGAQSMAYRTESTGWFVYTLMKPTAAKRTDRWVYLDELTELLK